MNTIEESIKEINSVFSFFQDPMEKIEQLIDYGKMASGISEDLKVDENKIAGCTSMAWVICKNNNEKVYIISGEVVLRESSFFDEDTLVYGGSLILFNNKSVTFSSSPRRVVKSIINNQILHNVDIPAEILKEYSLISSVGELQPEQGMITIPLRSSSGEFKSLIIEYYINEK